MADVTPFPWARVMQFAFGRLRLSPQAFWSMTLRELNHAMAGSQGASPATMTRSQLDRLISRYPDDRGQDDHPD